MNDELTWLRERSVNGAEEVKTCGAYAVTEWDSGSPRAMRWCERTSGPCPFPGADKMGTRSCGALRDDPH